MTAAAAGSVVREARPDAAAERDLLDQARRCSAPPLEQLTAQHLAELAADRGVDFATTLLFTRVVASQLHGPALARVDELKGCWQQGRRLAGVRVLIVPGAYYREYPEIGGDGRIVAAAARTLGGAVELAPCPSVGGLADGVAAIMAAVERQPEKPTILVSLSKGSGDVKAALQRGGGRLAPGVFAWLDLCGICEGTALANRILDHCWLRALARALFWCRGHDFQFLRDLVVGPAGPLAQPLCPAPPLAMLHVVGFPLQHHLSTPLLRRNHRRLARLGPNDGCTLLAHAVTRPGAVYPLWGADHYIRPAGCDMQDLAGAALTYLAETSAASSRNS